MLSLRTPPRAGQSGARSAMHSLRKASLWLVGKLEGLHHAYLHYELLATCCHTASTNVKQ